MIRRPVVSGMFYPHRKENLNDQLSKFFKSVKNNDFVCVVSPHAGYEYSGKTAARAIGSLKPSGRFIILGPNHNLMGHAFSLPDSTEWETPLGTLKIDSELAEEIGKSNVIQTDELAHMNEHSIEVQLPFLQYKFNKFTFVPISISNADYSKDFLKQCEILGKHIAKTIKGKNVNVIASSDFSHYLPRELANEKDERAIDAIKKLDAEALFETLDNVKGSVCGYGPIAVLLYIAKELGLKKSEIIDHTDSGEATRDSSSVVSYYAIGFK